MTFGNYFRALRVKKKVTQRQIAETIGKSTMLISGVESGKNGPFSEPDLNLIAEKLNLTVSEKNELFNEAAKARGKLPSQLADYIFQHPEAYEVIEVLAEKNLNGDALLRVAEYIERIK